jgi:hypothetical protein
MTTQEKYKVLFVKITLNCKIFDKSKTVLISLLLKFNWYHKKMRGYKLEIKVSLHQLRKFKKIKSLSNLNIMQKYKN